MINAGFKSCQDEATWLELRGASLPQSFKLLIDSDGRGPLAPFKVECVLDSSGKYETVVHHNHESNTTVRGYESAGSFKEALTYTGASLPQLTALVDASISCKQFLHFSCHGATMTWSGVSLTYWLNRDGQRMLHWGGGIPGKLSCACYRTNSCAGKRLCNCDANDKTWRYDFGYLTDKNNLPVTEVHAGDTGHAGEEAQFFVGPLICTD